MTSIRSTARVLALVTPTLIGLAATSIRRSEARPAGVFASGGPVKGPSVEQPVTVADGAYSVATRTGAAELSIPVPVPPGRRGMQPDLKLSYSSQGALRGGIAAGWSLSGIPSIRVDTSEGRLAGLHYLSTLAGNQRLEQVDDPETRSGVLAFRAEHDDSYTRYEYYPSPTDPGYWRVMRPDGITMMFGDMPDSRDEPQGEDTGAAARWFITTVTDRMGNQVRYNWTRVPAMNRMHGLIDVQPDTIEYTFNDAAGIGPHARISFVYSPTQDLCPGSEVPIGARFDYRTGIRLYEGASRLERIETWVDSGSGAGFSKRHELALGYDATELSCTLPRAPLRLLTQVAETAWAEDGTPSVKPPQTFSYSRARARQLTNQIEIPFEGNLGRGKHWMTQYDGGKWPYVEKELRDLDGDGRTDWLESTGRGVTGGPIVETDTPPDPTYDLCGFNWRAGLNGAPTASTLPALPWGDSSAWLGEACSLSVQFSRRTTHDSGCSPTNYNSYRYMDFDGDGRSDLVTALDYGIKRYAPPEDDLLDDGPWGTTPSNPADQSTCRAGGPGCNTTTNSSFDLYGWYSAPLPPDGWSTTASTCLDPSECTDPSCIPHEPDLGCMAEVGDFFLCGGNACVCAQQFCPCMGLECFTDSGVFGNEPGGLTGENPTLSQTQDHCPIYHETQGYYFRWRIYRNQGNGTFSQVPEIHLSPIPLESDFATSDLGGYPGSSWHGFADLDGDGCVDALWQTPPTLGDYDGYRGELQMFRGDCRGNFLQGPGDTPYLWPAPMIGDRARISARMTGLVDPDIEAVRYSDAADELVDINGDGLADLVTNRDLGGYAGDSLWVYYNTGAGFEMTPKQLTSTAVSGGDTSAMSRQISIDLNPDLEETPGIGIYQVGYSRSSRRDIDIDEDGLVDLVDLPPPVLPPAGATPYSGLTSPPTGTSSVTPVAYVNVGDRLVRVVAPTLSDWAEGLARVETTDKDWDSKDQWIVKTDFRDLNGDGRPDLFRNEDRVCPTLGDPASYHLEMWEGCGSSTHAYTDSPADRVAGLVLLEEATLSTGGRVSFSYAPVTDMTVVDDDSAAGRRTTSPLWVVEAVTVDPLAGLAAIGTTQRASLTRRSGPTTPLTAPRHAGRVHGTSGSTSRSATAWGWSDSTMTIRPSTTVTAA